MNDDCDFRTDAFFLFQQRYGCGAGIGAASLDCLFKGNLPDLCCRPGHLQSSSMPRNTSTLAGSITMYVANDIYTFSEDASVPCNYNNFKDIAIFCNVVCFVSCLYYSIHFYMMCICSLLPWYH